MRYFKPRGERELTAVHKVQEIFHSMHLIPCTACRYCTDGCPQQISIPDLFAAMNSKQILHDWNADYYYGVHTGPVAVRPTVSAAAHGRLPRRSTPPIRRACRMRLKQIPKPKVSEE